ncbi:N-acyl amino acid synthase FeeM domain-containing protein [Sessilibacter corallicola]|uniref:N-acyl amino acid synthase FeeM catalytic core domain-containing protein n=1 Tax=Sessilibacter corallicola TaxID=2904075 RepID=A0ABQ0A9Q5_9GAMM|nr:hypothetical protein [Sessilibacter corallicola]MCE2030303.1 hypothetical protein [Sessilibacter corallicola]
MIGDNTCKSDDAHIFACEPSCNVVSNIEEDVCITLNDSTLRDVKNLRKLGLSGIYPEMDIDNDPYDRFGLTLYKRNKNGALCFTVRLTFDGPLGLPESEFLQPLKAQGRRFVELGRLVITSQKIDDLKLLYRSCYKIAMATGHDSIVMAMKPKDISFHERLMGVLVVCDDMKVDYGGPYSLACVVWKLEETKDKFFNWAQLCR